MIDLTQKILSLDLETALELNNANAVSMEAKREADLRAEQCMAEAQHLFEKQKRSEAKQLAKSVKEDRKSAIDNLQQKMEAFDKGIEIDMLVEHLVTVARDRICR
ncbi:hypothetical protein ACLHDG_10415 [Sulfurovum sp. CS9]|uniref:hypothetical protein n=1 Tax=Sulfurovum sp. CS9 TaxID=3391146 RepID=UPI0039ED3D51